MMNKPLITIAGLLLTTAAAGSIKAQSDALPSCASVSYNIGVGLVCTPSKDLCCTPSKDLCDQNPPSWASDACAQLNKAIKQQPDLSTINKQISDYTTRIEQLKQIKSTIENLMQGK